MVLCGCALYSLSQAPSHSAEGQGPGRWTKRLACYWPPIANEQGGANKGCTRVRVTIRMNIPARVRVRGNLIPATVNGFHNGCILVRQVRVYGGVTRRVRTRCHLCLQL
jgi:hypothetical protein